MNLLIFMVLGAMVGLGIRGTLPGWRGASLSESVATLLVAAAGSTVMAMLASSLPFCAAFLSPEPEVLAAALAGAALAVALLRSPVALQRRVQPEVELVNAEGEPAPQLVTRAQEA